MLRIAWAKEAVNPRPSKEMGSYPSPSFTVATGRAAMSTLPVWGVNLSLATKRAGLPTTASLLRHGSKFLQVDIMVDLPAGKGYATLLRLFIRTVVSW